MCGTPTPSSTRQGAHAAPGQLLLLNTTEAFNRLDKAAAIKQVGSNNRCQHASAVSLLLREGAAPAVCRSDKCGSNIGGAAKAADTLNSVHSFPHMLPAPPSCNHALSHTHCTLSVYTHGRRLALRCGLTLCQVLLRPSPTCCAGSCCWPMVTSSTLCTPTGEVIKGCMCVWRGGAAGSPATTRDRLARPFSCQGPSSLSLCRNLPRQRMPTNDAQLPAKSTRVVQGIAAMWSPVGAGLPSQH